MRTYLTYNHRRELFTKDKFKSFVRKYFINVKFEGFGCGYWCPTISIAGTVGDIKIEDLPKSYRPHTIQSEKEFKENL